MVRGLTVCGWANALRKNRFAASASRLAESKKSIVWPRLSTARYRYIQRPLTLIHPAALNLHVRLVHLPGAGAHAQVRPEALLQFDSIGLDPPEDGGVIHLHASIQQHELE